jgi:uncharacterized protein YkwD
MRVVALAALVAVTTAGAAGWAVQQSAERDRANDAIELGAAEAARARVDTVLAASRPGYGTAAVAPASGVLSVATYTAERASEIDELTAAADEAAATLGRSRHAGDAADELRTAVRNARAVAKDDGSTLVALRAARAGLVGPAAAATAAEKVWRDAEAERRAEALRLAQDRQDAGRDTRQDGQQDTGAAPPSPNPSIPQGGLVCSGTGGPGATEASMSSLGAAINAYRASLGLSQLAVARSGSLVGHALDMGTTGGIWHSGRDNIVGCSGSADPAYLVQAWSHSPSHDEQMRRTDVSTMDVGAALQSGWLFGAVLFH